MILEKTDMVYFFTRPKLFNRNIDPGKTTSLEDYFGGEGKEEFSGQMIDMCINLNINGDPIDSRSLVLVFSLSLHRHPYLCISFRSLFISYYKNNISQMDGPLPFLCTT